MKLILYQSLLIMKTLHLLLILSSFAAVAADQAPPPASPAPPPAAPVKRSAADLEKLVAPIALYPDPLIATLLPASVYPLEIVQAARFVANTNNLAKLDEQPWDVNVKAVARLPEVVKKMNDDLPWTMELGEAFLAQDKDLMDAIQTMRVKAQSFGTLKTSPQQVVVVTNVVVEKTVEQKVVVVTNTVVQIKPSNPEVIYVPTYSPAVVYAPPPPSYTGLAFAAGMVTGAIIANNNCNWGHGGCYHGDVNVDIDRNVNVNNNVNRNANVNTTSGARASSTGAQQKWQPDQSRLSKSGTPSASAVSQQARGWSAGGAGPSTGGTGARPSAATAGARPSTGTPSASRPAPSPSASQPKASPSASRPSSSGSAFSGASSGARASDASSRGASSRSSGGGARGGSRR
jgi:hypothetical protein